jgi:hypothetical protein
LNLRVSVLRRALDGVDNQELAWATGRLESKTKLLAQRRKD